MTDHLMPTAINLAPHTHLTYPHTNGFTPDGRAVVIAQMEGETVSFWRCELETHEMSLVTRIAWDASGGRDALFFDIALRAPRMAVFDYEKLLVFDLNAPQMPLREIAAPPGSTFQLGSMAPNGAKVLVGVNHNVAPGAKSSQQFQAGVTRHEIAEFDIESGEKRSILERDWWTNHVQLSPFDTSWIGFCHEGDTAIPDRVWGFHPEKMPQGRLVFDQRLEDGRPQLHTGHEIWSFDKLSIYTVVFHSSPRGPKGVYEVFLDGRQPRLVTQGEYDWHTAPSRDGKWAVLDTNGPHNPELFLINTQTGARAKIADIGPDNWKHPYHPHPVFTPDNRFVLWNDRAWGVRMASVEALQQTLL
jgi:hypothetical protein